MFHQMTREEKQEIEKELIEDNLEHQINRLQDRLDWIDREKDQVQKELGECHSRLAQRLLDLSISTGREIYTRNLKSHPHGFGSCGIHTPIPTESPHPKLIVSVPEEPQ